MLGADTVPAGTSLTEPDVFIVPLAVGSVKVTVEFVLGAARVITPLPEISPDNCTFDIILAPLVVVRYLLQAMLQTLDSLLCKSGGIYRHRQYERR
jgi:hypothetical protein